MLANRKPEDFAPGLVYFNQKLLNTITMKPNRKHWMWMIMRFSRKLKDIIRNPFAFMPEPDFNGQYDETML